MKRVLVALTLIAGTASATITILAACRPNHWVSPTVGLRQFVTAYEGGNQCEQ
jgi:hypothetical protein